jgi:hypothetical protein
MNTVAASPSRRRALQTTFALTATGLLVPRRLLAAPPTNDPAAKLGFVWTAKLRWDQVLDVTTVASAGEFWDARVEAAQATLAAKGGGVVFFPPGTYRFKDDLQLRSGIVLRGAEPTGATSASDEKFSPPSKIVFPRYVPSFTGSGTPKETAFKGIVLADPATAADCGVVHLDLDNGYINLPEAEEHRCGARRLVLGCVLRNAAGIMAEVPSAKDNQPGWLRYPHKFRAAIRVHASEHALIANNRIPKSGEANFVMKDFPLEDRAKKLVPFDVVFDFDNRPGIYLNHHCIGGAGGSGNDGTPETHPWGFRKGLACVDNYVFATGRCAIGFCGDGVVCSRNTIRFAKDVPRPTVTGTKASYGSATNDNRAMEIRGWRWVVENNDYEVFSNTCSDGKYRINDGEGLMHEDHCNSTIVDSRLVGNRGNSYLSLFHVGEINGLHVEGNDITSGHISAIYVTAARHKQPGDFPIRRVTIVKNTTRGQGIRVQGWPSEKVVVKDNRHVGETPAALLNDCPSAELANNTNYEVKQTPVKK